MRLWLRAALALLALADLSDQAFGPYPSITNETFIKWVVDVHNKYRSEVNPTATNMLYMTWDVALARTARAWANRCTFKHSPYRKSHPDSSFWLLGENIWISNAMRRHFDPTSAIAMWNSEVVSYTYQNHQCTSVCGHYTQVSHDILHNLKEESASRFMRQIVFQHLWFGVQVVVDFAYSFADQSGNSPRRPYMQGRPCSACPQGDTCENNLCRNPERDKIIRYTRWYPPFEYRIVCDESCIALAILRPLLMFLGFGVLYYLQQRYPNLSVEE